MRTHPSIGLSSHASTGVASASCSWKFILAWVVAISLGQVATPVRGSTYYVAVDGRTDGDGTPSRPWPTVEYALSKVGGGNTMLLKPGTYSGAILIGSAYSGTSAAPTVVKSEHKWQARIVGSPGYGIYTGSTAQYVVIDGFEVTASQSSGMRIHSSNNTVRNCWIHDNTNGSSNGIEAHGVSDALIENNLVESNGSGGQGQGIYADGTRLTIRANIVRNNAGYGVLLSPAITNSVVSSNLVYGHKGPSNPSGIRIQAASSGTAAGNNLTTNNTCVDNYTGISVCASTQEKLVNNICVDNVFAPFFYCQGTAASGVENDWNVTRPASPYDGPHTASNQDPLFVNLASGDYRLMPTSPAIELANPAYAPSTDITGRPTNVPPDAGAYAYDPIPLGYCYVAPDGRADGDGSRLRPLASVEEACGRGCNTILLAPGTYTGPIVISSACSGTPDSPREIRSEYKQQARIVGSPGYGIYTGSSAQYVIIDGFEITGSQSSGARIYGSNNVIRNCWIHDNSSNGIQAHGVSDTLIENNLVESNGSAGQGQGIYADGTRLTIRANIARNNAGYGLLLSPAITSSLISTNLVHGHKGPSDPSGIRIQAAASGTAAGNNLVTNNTCVDNYTGISVYASTQEKVVNNICVDNTYATFFYGQGTVASGVENDWNVTRPASPYDGPHTASNEDPLFVNAADGDYRLLPGSPAIGAGNPAYVPGRDIAGRPYYPGCLTPGVDAGAYAYDPVNLGYCYVSPDGSTSNDGSICRPWPTVEYALSQVGGGKTIFLRPGVYTGPIRIDHSGTPERPTKVISEYKWQARIVGSPTYGIYTSSAAQHVVIDGFEVTSSQSSGVRIYGGNNTVRNCWIHDSSSDGIQAHGVSDTLIENNLVESNGSAGQGQGIYADGTRLTIRANIARHNAGHGLLLSPAITSSLISTNLVHGHKGPSNPSGILIQAAASGTAPGNNLVTNNTCVDNYTGISVYASTQEKIVNNICVYNVYTFLYGGGTVPGGVENDWNVTCPASPYDGPHTVHCEDPLFVNPACGDYRLMPTSPLSGAANPAYAPVTDITGRPTNTPPDPGAYSIGALLVGGTCTSPADFDKDGHVDGWDLEFFRSCASGPGIAYTAYCVRADFDVDKDVDQADFAVVQRCYSGANKPADPNCDN